MPDLNNSFLHILLSAQSGKDDPKEVRKIIEDTLVAAGRNFTIYFVEDPEELVIKAQQAIKSATRDKGILVVAGGDGGINSVIQKVIQSDCPVGIIPVGTFNFFARTHQIPEALDGALTTILNGYYEPVQVGMINEKIFLVNASLGLYPDLLEDRERFKRRWGRSRFVAAIAGLYFLALSRQIIHLKLTTQTRSIELQTPSLFVANNSLQLENLGIAEADKIEQGKLVAIVPRPLNKWAMVKLLFKGILADLGNDKNILSFTFDKMNVRFARFLGSHVKAAIDGEIIWLKTPIEISVAERALLLVKPRPTND
jgi:diacylglycerol kinase family enzyme